MKPAGVVDGAENALGCFIAVGGAEQGDGQLRVSGDLHARDAPEALGGLPGQVEHAVQGFPEGRDAVQVQRQPGQQATEGPGVLRAPAEVVRQPADFLDVTQVSTVGSVCPGQGSGVLHDEPAYAVRQEQALVGVDGDRIGSLDPPQALGSAFGEGEEAAVGGVDVEPGVVLSGDVGEFGKRVDGSGVSVTGGGHQQPWPGPLGAVLRQPAAQRGQVDQVAAVGGHGPCLGVRDPAEPQPLANRVMYPRGQVHR